MSEILIYDFIGESMFEKGVIAKDIKAQLDAAEGTDVTVRINSPGGDVFEGIAIGNLLKQYEGSVSVKIDGYAASIASVIAMAGDSVEIAPNAMFMIHNPYTMAMGDARDFRKQADTLDKVKDTLITSYQAKSDRSAEELSYLMDAETWFHADESVSMGFANNIAGDGVELTNLDAVKWINKAPSLEAQEAKKEADEANRFAAQSAELNRLSSLGRDNGLEVARAEMRAMRKNLVSSRNS